MYALIRHAMPGTAVLHCEGAQGFPRCRGDRTHAIFRNRLSGISFSRSPKRLSLLVQSTAQSSNAVPILTAWQHPWVSHKENREHEVMTVTVGMPELGSHRRCRRSKRNVKGLTVAMTPKRSPQKPKGMHSPGIEPGSGPWQGPILPLDQECSTLHVLRVGIFQHT